MTSQSPVHHRDPPPFPTRRSSDRYTGGSGSTALTFSYTVGAGDDIGDLAVTAFNLNGATVSDAAGNSANVAGAIINPTGILQIDTIAPTVPSVAASGSGIDGELGR